LNAKLHTLSYYSRVQPIKHADDTVQYYKQVAQLSLTNPHDALHHDKRQNFKQLCDHNHALLWMICHPVVRIDIAYSRTKFDDFRFSRSSDMTGAPKFFNGSHDLTTRLSGTVCRP